MAVGDELESLGLLAGEDAGPVPDVLVPRFRRTGRDLGRRATVSFVSAAGGCAVLLCGALGGWAATRATSSSSRSAPPFAAARAPGRGAVSAFEAGAGECRGAAASLEPGHDDGRVFRCRDGACISVAELCDTLRDCADGSDEVGCGGGGAAATGREGGHGATAAVEPATAGAAALRGGAAAEQGCSERGGYKYVLDWEAKGKTFWDDWNFVTTEPNRGAAQYLLRDEAFAKGVTAAHATHAVLGAGPKGSYLKRTSAKVVTKRKWMYFLMALKYESVPWGCGVWPAFWTLSPDAPWPKGGELDVLEFANEIPSRTSLHVDAWANRCRLDPRLLNRPGCPPMVDAEYNFTGGYDCATAYPQKLGCAPNLRPRMLNGEELSRRPSVVVTEWTPEFIKVFLIPSDQVPADLAADAPRPDEWDKWLISYYPFAASERSVPGSCPNPGGLLKGQQIILSLGFCGDWASKIWETSTCAKGGPMASSTAGQWSARGPTMGSECFAVDPHNPMGQTPSGPRDCCTRFIYDEHNEYDTEAYLAKHGFWNVSWLKVFQHKG